MENQHIFKLIDGSFSNKDSREILLNVFTGKIQFHQRKNFSSQERFGKEDEIALTRIPQLKKSLEDILKLIETAETRGEQLEIIADVRIKVIKATENV